MKGGGGMYLSGFRRMPKDEYISGAARYLRNMSPETFRDRLCRKGHMYEEHTGRTYEEMVNRAVNEGKPGSSFLDYWNGNPYEWLREMMDDHLEDIAELMKDPDREEMEIESRFPFPVGVGCTSDLHIKAESDTIRLVLRKDHGDSSMGLYIVTAYPDMDAPTINYVKQFAIDPYKDSTVTAKDQDELDMYRTEVRSRDCVWEEEKNRIVQAITETETWRDDFNTEVLDIFSEKEKIPRDILSVEYKKNEGGLGGMNITASGKSVGYIDQTQPDGYGQTRSQRNETMLQVKKAERHKKKEEFARYTGIPVENIKIKVPKAIFIGGTGKFAREMQKTMKEQDMRPAFYADGILVGHISNEGKLMVRKAGVEEWKEKFAGIVQQKETDNEERDDGIEK